MADGGKDLEVRTDDGSACVTDDWVGEFIFTSWGYGQTNVDLAQVIEVSGSGKTVLAQIVTPEVVNRDRGSDTVAPTDERLGEPFRLHVREFSGDAIFRGSYPYVSGDPEDGTSLGSFHRYDSEDGGIHQTSPGYGH